MNEDANNDEHVDNIIEPVLGVEHSTSNQFGEPMSVTEVSDNASISETTEDDDDGDTDDEDEPDERNALFCPGLLGISTPSDPTTTAPVDVLPVVHSNGSTGSDNSPNPSTGFTADREEALKTVHSIVNNVMLGAAYDKEIDFVKERLEFNILLMGAPRIGKSQLTNALTGNTIHRARTSDHLEACTQRMERYEVKCGSIIDAANENRSRVFIWDTKGIENWQEENLIPSLFRLIDRIQPIAVIYCAAPGTFANLRQVELVLNYCAAHKIFCAAVVTNMWSGTRDARMTVMKDLEALLADFGPRKVREFQTDDPILKKHEVIMFGDRALCTMVNSTPFFNPDLSPVAKPIRGIDEITYCIMQSLSDDKVRGWCQAVLGNRSFWEKLHHRAHGFVLNRYTDLHALAGFIRSNIETFTITMFHRFFAQLST